MCKRCERQTCAPEQELGEEVVAAVASEVFEQHLRHLAAVLEEAEDCDEHLDELDGRELLHALHVVHTQRHTLLVWKITKKKKIKNLKLKVYLSEIKISKLNVSIISFKNSSKICMGKIVPKNNISPLT